MNFLSQKIQPGDTAVVDVAKDGKVKLLVGERFDAPEPE